MVLQIYPHINQIIMKNKGISSEDRTKQLVGLIRDNFRITDYVGAVQHTYFLQSNFITSADLPAILKEVEKIEQSQNRQEHKICMALRNNRVGEKGCIVLSRVHLRNLSYLNLDSNSIGVEGCKQLTKGQWPDLQQLYLRNNQITVRGCDYLSRGEWNRLRHLQLNSNPIENFGYRLLCLKFPESSIYCEWQYKWQWY